MDRRVQRTRKLLCDSLMSLILEEGYDAISIQDITDKANLGRATFYLHFKDKDELLAELIDHFLSEFLGNVPQFSLHQWRLEDTKSITKLFDFAAEHYDLYRILIIGSGGITASRKLQHIIAENVKACIQKEIDELGAEPVLPLDFIAEFSAGMLLATIFWWLDKELPYSSEEMAVMFQKINTLSQDSLMGLDKPEKALPIPESKAKEKKPPREKPTSKKNKKVAEAPTDEKKKTKASGKSKTVKESK
jgi:AcrR family transcriptional regulator